MPLFVPILYALGGVVLRAAVPAAAKALVKLGAKKVSKETAKQIGGRIVTATPKVIAKAKAKKGGLKTKVKKPNTTTKPKENTEQFGPGGSTMRPMTKPKPKPKTKPKPKPKKPEEKVPEQFAPGGGGARPLQMPKPKPSSGKAKKGGLKTKVKKPANKTSGSGKAKKGGLKTKKSPFAKRTNTQKLRDKIKEQKRLQRMRDDARKNPSRDPKGKYQTKPISKPSVPKTGAKKGGLKSRLDAKAKKTATGLGITAVKVSNLDQNELKVLPRKLNKDTNIPTSKDNLKPRTGGPSKGGRGSEGDRFKDRTMKKPESKLAPKTSSRPKKRTDETFGQAFKRNRKAGKPTFTFKNKRYTTRLKEESIEAHKKKFGVKGKY